MNASVRLRPDWKDLSSLPRRESLIEGLLDIGAFSIFYGPSGSKKTFIVIDIAAHVATGRKWCDLEVKQGPVVFIAAEGGAGIDERLTAWRKYHKVTAGDVPFYVVADQVDLCSNSKDVDLLVKMFREYDINPALVIIDTVARALAGGDENGSADMGRFVNNCDKLRLETGAHVLAIHHTGKDSSRGARGHSSLKAASDTEIEIQSIGLGMNSKASVAKQRDHPTGGMFGFELKIIPVRKDKKGNDVTSCVAVAMTD